MKLRILSGAFAVFLSGLSTTPAWGQDANSVEATSISPEEIESLDLGAMDVDSLLSAAEVALEHAEGGSDDADQALNEANRFVSAALSKAPNELKALYYRGRILHLSGRTYDALPLLQQWANSDPGQSDWIVFKLLGDIYKETFPALAVPRYQRASTLNTNDSTIWMGLSDAQANLGAHDKAVEASEKAVVASGQSIETRSHLVSALFHAGRMADAEREAVRVVQEGGRRLLQSPSERGTMVELDQYLSDLTVILQTRIAGGEATPDTYARLSQFTVERAQIMYQLAYFDALEIVERGIRDAAPRRPLVLLLERIRLFLEVGQREDAERQLDELADEFPDNPTIRDLLKQLQDEN